MYRQALARIHGQGARLSADMGLSGKADVVEFHPDGRILPVEYKRSRPKSRPMDEIQVCAQAMCIEEMRGVLIGEGHLLRQEAPAARVRAAGRAWKRR